VSAAAAAAASWEYTNLTVAWLCGHRLRVLHPPSPCCLACIGRRPAAGARGTPRRPTCGWTSPLACTWWMTMAWRKQMRRRRAGRVALRQPALQQEGLPLASPLHHPQTPLHQQLHRLRRRRPRALARVQLLHRQQLRRLRPQAAALPEVSTSSTGLTAKRCLATPPRTPKTWNRCEHEHAADRRGAAHLQGSERLVCACNMLPVRAGSIRVPAAAWLREPVWPRPGYLLAGLCRLHSYHDPTRDRSVSGHCCGAVMDGDTAVVPHLQRAFMTPLVSSGDVVCPAAPRRCRPRGFCLA